MKTFLAALLACVAVLAGCNSNGRIQNTTDLRAINAIAEAEPVDILIEGDTKLGSVAFASTTPYTTFTAGNANVKVRSTTTQAVLVDTQYGLGNAVRNTVIAYGKRDAAATLLLAEDTIRPAGGRARVRVAQLAPDGGTIDVYLTAGDAAIGSPLTTAVPYPQVTAPSEVTAGNYKIVFTATGTTDVLFVSPAPRAFQDGGNYTILAMPSKGGKLLNALFLEQGTGGGTYIANTFSRLKAVNGIPGTMLNLKLDGAVALSQITFTGASSYLTTNAGAHTVAFEAANVPGVNLVSQALTLDAARDYTIVAGGTSAAPRLLALTDDNSIPASGYAKVRYLNLLVDGATVDVLFNAASQASGLAPFVVSSYFLTLPGTGLTIAFTTPGGVTTIAAVVNAQIDAGGVYTAYLFGTSASPQALLVRDR
jgi:hypothetical protein